jgi:molybdopterin molybdotransferase
MSPLLSREEAWGLIAAHAAPLETVRLPLDAAVGRVLSEDVASPLDIPGFDRSAMDGYAVRTADTPGRLRLAGEVAAGDAGDAPVEPGTAHRIFTGGPIPPGADAVQRQEDVRVLDDGTVELAAAVPPGNHVRRRGEDVPAGTLLLRAGERVTPQSLTVLAGAGLAELPVHRPARVAVLLTGDELVTPGQPLGPGQIYETSGVTLRTLLGRAGAEAVDLGTAPDDLAAITTAVERGLAEADVLLVAGGVSVGEHDHVKEALSTAGVEELFWGVRVKPGKPLFAGRTAAGRWAFGLPGNPLSGVVGFLLFIEPLLRRMHGDGDADIHTVPARTLGPVAASDGRTTYLTATVQTGADGVLEATPTAQQGSAMTLALARADGFVIAPDGEPEIPAGGMVRLLPL